MDNICVAYAQDKSSQWVSAVQEYAMGITAQKQKSPAFKFTKPSFSYVFYRYVISIEKCITK